MRAERLWWLAAAGAVAIRFWCSWCSFPASAWNAVRLAPSFMLRFGPTPFPGLNAGPLTTWIYGPVALFLNLPATLATGPAPALMVAGVINLLLALVPVGLAVGLLPASGSSATAADRAWAALLCLAVWPNSSLEFIQSDNAAIAFGLVANLLLIRGAESQPGRPPLVAAVAVALAVWSKQTLVFLVLAQILWLGAAFGPRIALRHAVATAAAGGILGAGFLVQFGWDGLWLNLVRLPGRLPFWPDPLDRLTALWPHVTGYVIAPLVVCIFFRRSIWRRKSPWLLPVLSWLALLPAGILATLKIGGTVNSLTGVLFLLPTAALAVVPWLRARARGFGPLIAAATVAGVAVQMTQVAARPFQPVTGVLKRGNYLAAEFPGEIYFPWNPLITWFTDHRFYHAEDGLYVRYVAGLEPDREQAFRDFPPRWKVTAFPSDSGGWGIVEHLEPADARRVQFGEWTLDSWPEPDVANPTAP